MFPVEVVLRAVTSTGWLWATSEGALALGGTLVFSLTDRKLVPDKVCLRPVHTPLMRHRITLWELQLAVWVWYPPTYNLLVHYTPTRTSLAHRILWLTRWYRSWLTYNGFGLVIVIHQSIQLEETNEDVEGFLEPLRVLRPNQVISHVKYPHTFPHRKSQPIMRD